MCSPAGVVNNRWTMQMKQFLAVSILLFSAGLNEAWAADYPLPPAVPDRIGRAQLFVNKIKDKHTLVGKRDIVWGDVGEKVEGLYSVKYTMLNRDPDRKHDLGWYRTNHPDWVVYKSDRESLPHEFTYKWGYFTPVDINNPAVREYLCEVNVKAEFGKRRFEGIGIDNVQSCNTRQRSGVWNNGVWHQQYGGATVDPAYARDVADWVGCLAARVHAGGMGLVINHYPRLEDEAGYRLVASKADVIGDEHGYTRYGKPMLTDQRWLQYISLFADLARTKAVLIVDRIAHDRSQVTPAVVNWALANYLLMKGDHTYVAWPTPAAETGTLDGTLDDYPELYLPIGRPLEDFARVGDVYRRHFERVIAVVNPADKTAAPYHIPSGSWHDLAGTPRSGTVNLPPGSGLVLVSGTSP